MVVWRSLCVIQFLILLAIFTYFGLLPHPEDKITLYNDKLMHFGGYFVAAFSISFAFPRWNFWWRALFLIVYSVAIEIGQHFMPPRTFDAYDIIANSTGVIVGLLLLTVLAIKLQWFKTFLHFGQK